MGHIKRVGNKKYKITIEAGIDPATGKRQRRSKTVNCTKEQAQRIMIKMVDSDDDYSRGHNVSLKEYLYKWIDDYENNISEITATNYRSIIKHHLVPALGKLKLADIKPAHILKYQTEKLDHGRLQGEGGLSKRSVQAHHRLLNLALKQAISPYRLIKSNPCAPINAPSPDKPKVYTLTKEDAQIVLDAIDNSLFYTLIYTALFTGVRRSELLGLKWKDINLKQKIMEIKRGAKELKGGGITDKKLKNDSSMRQIAMSESLTNVLKDHKKERAQITSKDTHVFLTPSGTRVRPNYLTKKFIDLARTCGYHNTRLHDLRHTHATWLLEEGVNPKIVQERLGHASIETTLNIYSHVSMKEQRKAADKLERLF